MTEPTVFTIHIDGAARGNPGPAAFAFVIAADGQPPIEGKGYLGTATNNQAEYTALVKALERAGRLGARRLIIYSDSELLVKQMNGLYRVKNDDLRALYGEARGLCEQFDMVSIRHVLRGQNARADQLCNEALDQQKRSGPAHHAAKPRRPAARDEAIRDQAVECLRTAAAGWARGNAADPPPEAVWEQLWSIITDAECGLRPAAF